VDARTFLPEEISAFLFTRVMNNRSTDVVQRWCMFTTRFSLFKAVLFSAKMRKARERERKSWELGESGRILSSLFCFVWNAAGGGGKRQKKNLFDLKVARQTKKQEVHGQKEAQRHKTTKKRRKRGRKRARFTRCSCYVLYL